MAAERFRLEVRERAERGSAQVRRLRRQGLIPGVLYGSGHEPRAITVPERDLRRALTGSHGLHQILDVVLEGQKTAHASILKDYQLDPVRGRVTHVDLQEVRLDRPIHATVAIDLVGDSAGVREGGVLSQAMREIAVEALPMEVPDRIELDVSGLAIGGALRISDLPALRGVVYLDDPETVVATVLHQMREVEAEELPEGEEAAAGAEAEAEPAEE